MTSSMEWLTECILKAKQSAICISIKCGMILDYFDDATSAKDVTLINDAIEHDFEEEATTFDAQENVDNTVNESDVICIKEEEQLLRNHFLV